MRKAYLVSAVDFRQIANRSKDGRSERLFRAAVSAFCSLTRPTRREIAQFEQLATPLFEGISPAARRFAAAALSDSSSAPHGLVMLLCLQPVETAAPLLMRSPVLADADLVAVIAARGLDHARVVARRPQLDPMIARLIDALVSASTPSRPAAAELIEPPSVEEAVEPAAEISRGDDVRTRLRSMMSASSSNPVSSHEAPEGLYQRLKETVLTGRAPFFHTALADALGIDYHSARSIASARSYDELLIAMRRLELTEEQAFLLVCAAAPKRFPDARAISRFIARFRECDPEIAVAEPSANWRADDPVVVPFAHASR